MLSRALLNLRATAPKIAACSRKNMSFWARDPFTDMRAMLREMEHQAEHMERAIANSLGHSRLLPSLFGSSRHVPLLRSADRQGAQQTFRLALDLSEYEPKDIKVSLKGRTLTVEARREVDEDGFRSLREMCHQYRVPEDVDVENLVSTLETDGVLSIEAPRAAPPSAEPKKIPIHKEGGGGGGQAPSLEAHDPTAKQTSAA